MTIHKNNNKKLIVELSLDELKTKGISPSELNLKNAEAASFLSEISSAAHFDCDKERNILFIDALFNETCVFLIYSFKPRSENVFICKFEEIENAYALSRAVSAVPNLILNNSLYKLGENYLAEIEFNVLDRNHLYDILSEFSDVKLADKTDISYLEEHGNKLCDSFILMLSA